MRIISSMPCLLAAIIYPSCNPAAQEAAVANGKTEIEIARDFNNLFPDSQNFISHFSGSKGNPKWNSRVGLHGRYVLSLQFDVSFDQTRSHPERDGEIGLFLVEVDAIGPNGITYTDRQIRFGIKEWQRVLDSNADFSVIGFPMDTDKPIEGFDTTWRY